jgi:hypothetical protein
MYVNTLEKAGYIDKVSAPGILDKKPGRNPAVYASRKVHNHKWTDIGKLHPYMISEVYGVLHAANRRFDIPLDEWYFEPEGRVVDAPKICNPDAEAVFNTELFFIECDRGTEPLKRNGKGTDIESRFDYYEALWRTGKKFRVLWLTLTDMRRFSMHKAAYMHDRSGKGLNIFWFGLYSLIDVTDPAKFLYSEDWLIPSDGIYRPLIKR